MKELFISQPMSGKTDEEVKAERADIIKACGNDGIEVIDSFLENAPDDVKPLWLLGKSLELLSEADIVYFADGWEKYRGCRIEHEAANEYGIEIVHD